MLPYRRIRENDSCPICRSENTINLITRDYYSINYKNILDNNLALPKMVIGLRCNNCKSVFDMKWYAKDNYKYPVPRIKIELDKFMDDYKKGVLQ